MGAGKDDGRVKKVLKDRYNRWIEQADMSSSSANFFSMCAHRNFDLGMSAMVQRNSRTHCQTVLRVLQEAIRTSAIDPALIHRYRDKHFGK
jgi:hypothetical protein